MPEVDDWLGLDIAALRQVPELAGLRLPPAELIGDRSYIVARAAGLSFVLADDATVDTVQLHAGGHEGHAAYAGPMPAGLRFAMDRAAVRARLGAPEAQGEKTKLPLLGEKPAWGRFVRNGHRLHIEYTLDGAAIRMISIF